MVNYQPLYVATDRTITSVENSTNNIQFCESNNKINTISVNSLVNKNINEDLNLSLVNGNPIIKINNNTGECNITSNLNVNNNLNVIEKSTFNKIINCSSGINYDNSSTTTTTKYVNPHTGAINAGNGDYIYFNPSANLDKISDVLRIYKNNVNIRQNVNIDSNLNVNGNLNINNCPIKVDTNIQSIHEYPFPKEIPHKISQLSFSGVNKYLYTGISTTNRCQLEIKSDWFAQLNLQCNEPNNNGPKSDICFQHNSSTIGTKANIRLDVNTNNYFLDFIMNKPPESTNPVGFNFRGGDMQLDGNLNVNNNLNVNKEITIYDSTINSIMNDRTKKSHIKIKESQKASVEIANHGGHLALTLKPKLNFSETFNITPNNHLAVEFHTPTPSGDIIKRGFINHERFQMSLPTFINPYGGEGGTQQVGITSTEGVVINSNLSVSNSLHVNNGAFFEGGSGNSGNVKNDEAGVHIGSVADYGHIELISKNKKDGPWIDFKDSTITGGSDYVGRLRYNMDYVTQGWLRPRFEFSNGDVHTHAGQLTTSDDRLKMNEALITGVDAKNIIMKLRPQTYDKYSKMNSDNKTTDLTSNKIFEAGLIAQEIYYEVPELRFIVSGSPTNETNTDDINISDSNIQTDPDYSNWGSETASVSYTQLIPYLIAHNKELQNEINTLKTQVATLNKLLNI